METPFLDHKGIKLNLRYSQGFWTWSWMLQQLAFPYLIHNLVPKVGCCCYKNLKLTTLPWCQMACSRETDLGDWKYGNPLLYRCKTFGITVTCDNWEGRLHIYRTCCSRRTQLEKAQATICWILLFTLGNVLQERDELERFSWLALRQLLRPWTCIKWKELQKLYNLKGETVLLHPFQMWPWKNLWDTRIRSHKTVMWDILPEGRVGI